MKKIYIVLAGLAVVLGSACCNKIEDGKEVKATTSASDFCKILTEVFNSDDFEFRGITGKCEGNEKSHISWADDGTVQKEAIKYIVKENTKG